MYVHFVTYSQFGIAVDFQRPGVEDNFGGGIVILLITIVTVVSIGIAVGTGYLLYTNEFKSDDVSDGDGDVDGAEYRGAEMTSNNTNTNTSSGNVDAAVAV